MADLQAGGSPLSAQDQADFRAGLGLGDAATKSVGTAAGSVAAGDDARLSNAREWTAATVTQAEAEALTDTARKAWTVQRVVQAVAAWWAASAMKTKLDGIAAGATVNAADAALRDRSTHTGTQAASTVTMATARLLGRTTAGAGGAEEIAVGSGLTLAGGTLSAVTGAGIAAPSTLDSASGSYNGGTLHLAAAGTLTVAAGALAVLPGGVTILVGQSGSATLAFSGGATKENASGTSASSVTLAACGVYALLPSPSGSDKWRLSGGASL